jgi:hypothetical protein
VSTAQRFPGDTTDLRARLASQDAELAAQRVGIARLRADLSRLQHRRYAARSFLPLVLVAVLVALVPLATLAATPFSDLNPESVHNPNIVAIADAGITKGCDPGVAYCPNGLVTREEMASFLARTAGLGNNPPVVNAKTAQTAVNAQTADNAAAVGGYAPSALSRMAFSATALASTLPGSNTNIDIARLTLTIPGPAPQAVAVRGALNTHGQTSNGFVLVRLRQDDGGLSGNLAFPYLTVASSIGISPSTQYVFIAAPGTHTYTLSASAASTNGPLNIFNPTLIATTHPFGPTGIPGTVEVAPVP